MSEAVSRREAFRRGVMQLRRAGIPNPALDASVLLGHVTGQAAAPALVEGERPLEGPEEARYAELIARRGRREALSRLVGSREFYSRPFLVTPDVLDPRPETETLVEKALEFLRKDTGLTRILDVGTGSGVIAVTLAAEAPEARVTATDVCPRALWVARANAVTHGVEGRIRLVCMDLASAFRDVPSYDLIVANPPYIAEHEFRDLPEEVRQGDPRAALIAGPAGLEFYPALAALAGRLLRPGGALMVEVGAGQGRDVAGIFGRSGFERVGITADLAGTDRVVHGWRIHA
ncbi:MAG: peptide chain release factor N(5)-glutamine methyltransferase [bacterium]|nr:MAG: peptide chain release factor N(5)-glutamine methyltransferase [bacterium]